MPMKHLSMVALAAWIAAPALAQEVDVRKAVNCQTLSQQFGDSVDDAEADDAAIEAATEQAENGADVCTEHDYDGGMDQLRQALQQIDVEPIR